jgi:hypothetical protein
MNGCGSAIFEGFFFEWVIAVGVFAFDFEDQRGQQVGGDEEGAPAFALAHVDSFVGAGAGMGGGVAGDDDVAEGHGGRAAGERDEAFEEVSGEAAIDLEDAGMPARAAAGEEGWKGDQKANGACRQNPDVKQYAQRVHGVVDRRLGPGVDKLAGGGACPISGVGLCDRRRGGRSVACRERASPASGRIIFTNSLSTARVL